MSKKALVINTSSVKVQFMTSSKDFTETMAKFWVAINEMADKSLILRKNIRIERDWMENHKTDEEIAKAEETIKKYEEDYSEFMKEYNARIDSCYVLIDKTVYKSYITGEESFRKALKEWFKAQKIEPTLTLINFMVTAVGYKNSSNKQLYKTGNALSFKGEKAFKKSFMSALAQLMKDKNALKVEAYKYSFK